MVTECGQARETMLESGIVDTFSTPLFIFGEGGRNPRPNIKAAHASLIPHLFNIYYSRYHLKC